jgi:DNA-binding CsgD family transcriptional regulator
MDGHATRELEQARQLYARRAWTRAFDAFAAADRGLALDGHDLERLATSAYFIGRDDDYIDALGRAHHAHLRAGERMRGVRCTFWLSLRLLLRGDTAHANGWLARGERLVEDEDVTCVERAYLSVLTGEQAMHHGDFARAKEIAARVVEIADHRGDIDLLTCAQHLQGHILLRQGHVARGLAQLDEVMLAATAGTLSPILTGLMYCSVISACQAVCSLSRAREWTNALSNWCEQQPEMLAFTGACLVHRAEVMHLHGAWHEALNEARRVVQGSGTGTSSSVVAAAYYQIAEVHRLSGDFRAAAEGYRSASRYGLEPQPGLALLRFAQGRTTVAAATLRRVQDTVTDAIKRVKILPAHVEIMLAAGDFAAAHAACDEIEEIAARFATEGVAAAAAQARGMIELAEDDARTAVTSLRRALALWQTIDAPYSAARTRVAIARACLALGDEDGASLELEAAGATFERLGAQPDLADIEALKQPRRITSGVPSGLTHRQLQVLRLVATGKTNRQIAADLLLSEKTVDRHVSNILVKLSVPSRAAATAYAYQHRLL